MPRLNRPTESLALFGTLLATFGELHPACDHALDAAEIVSTMSSVSVPRLATGGSRCRPPL